MSIEESRYLVPASNLDALREKAAKFARKAAKLGVVGPEIVIGAHVATMVCDDGTFHDLHEVHVAGEVPRVSTGHDFIAKIHHMSPTLALVMQPEGAEPMPAHYRTRGAYCDHCKTLRPRHDTFVLRAETGEHVQVGRSCLADFMPPREAAAIVAMAEWLKEAREACGEESERQPRGRGFHRLETYLAAVVRVVEADGFFMSRKLADERGGCPTTASTASMLVEAPLRRTQQWARDMLEAYGEAWALADSAHRVKARAALAWGAALTDDECMASEYLYNVRTLARAEWSDHKGLGIAASIPTAHARYLGRIAEREASARAPKSHFGTVGKRETFTLTVVRVVPIESQYGTAYLHVFRDANGNAATWRSTGSIAGQEGDVVTLTGTVKEHGEYKGTPQTVLTRCKVAREAEAQAA
jgi:hypothetical protein